jgi:exodeoxyribonuclease III
LERLEYRTKEWDNEFRNYLLNLKSKKRVILCGDLNVAHEEIDIHKAKGNEKSAGFTKEERKGFTDLLNSGFIDTFRHLNPKTQKFSYWSARFNNRETNKGWRLDYFVVDKDGMGHVVDSTINNDIKGSDHCPIELLYKPN